MTTTTPDDEKAGLETLYMQETLTRHDSAALRLSTWTVVGSVFASVLTAGVLGGTSGILQIPTLVNQVASLINAREPELVVRAQTSERVRSSELSIDALQRQLNELSARQTALTVRQDAMAAAETQLDISTQRQISELEGRSKDRNTQTLGGIATLQAGLNDQNERLKLVADSLSALRSNVYDLATRSSIRPSPGSLTIPGFPTPRSYGQPPPLLDRQRGNRDLESGPALEETATMNVGQSMGGNIQAKMELP